MNIEEFKMIENETKVLEREVDKALVLLDKVYNRMDKCLFDKEESEKQRNIQNGYSIFDLLASYETTNFQNEESSFTLTGEKVKCCLNQFNESSHYLKVTYKENEYKNEEENLIKRLSTPMFIAKGEIFNFARLESVGKKSDYIDVQHHFLNTVLLLLLKVFSDESLTDKDLDSVHNLTVHSFFDQFSKLKNVEFERVANHYKVVYLDPVFNMREIKDPIYLDLDDVRTSLDNVFTYKETFTFLNENMPVLVGIKEELLVLRQMLEDEDMKKAI